jgi:hypothetical protein
MKHKVVFTPEDFLKEIKANPELEKITWLDFEFDNQVFLKQREWRSKLTKDIEKLLEFERTKFLHLIFVTPMKRRNQNE